ncbi:nitric oxide synthase-like [Nilaparvata lugens]|uniref:nitric oxide synthase-like n=1 Tax=Nilaparvata lugens TaxID=108931 RepID=UPI00193DC181|nr:nitric oxide synthase-like [Nilaparvata lugens]
MARHGAADMTSLPAKPIKLKNIATRMETYDALHGIATQDTTCSQQACLASVMNTQILRSGTPRAKDEILRHAKDFLEQYFGSVRRSISTSMETRWAQVQSEVETTGTYQLTETELVYGAKLAWRNSARCIGRIQWSKLQVNYTKVELQRSRKSSCK